MSEPGNHKLSSPPYQDVGYEVKDGICTITLKRHDGKGNALSQNLISELRAAFTQAGGDDEVKSIILRSGLPEVDAEQGTKKKYFCVGIDVKEMRAAMQIPDDAERRAVNRAHCDNLSMLCDTMASCPKPIIGAADGIAVGGGATLLALCDWVIAKEGTCVDKHYLDKIVAAEEKDGYTLTKYEGRDVSVEEGTGRKYVLGKKDVTSFSYPEKEFNMLPWISVPWLLRRLCESNNEVSYMNARLYLNGETGSPDIELVKPEGAGDTPSVVTKEARERGYEWNISRSIEMGVINDSASAEKFDSRVQDAAELAVQKVEQGINTKAKYRAPKAYEPPMPPRLPEVEEELPAHRPIWAKPRQGDSDSARSEAVFVEENDPRVEDMLKFVTGHMRRLSKSADEAERIGLIGGDRVVLTTDEQALEPLNREGFRNACVDNWTAMRFDKVDTLASVGNYIAGNVGKTTRAGGGN